MAVEEDIYTLRELLRFIREVLDWLRPVASGVVFLAAKNDAHPPEEHFEAAWSGVIRELGAADDLLEKIHGVDDEHWKGLEAAGLTGAALALKHSVLRFLVARFRRSPRGILGWLNSFLGSIAAVFGGLEIVKEYKEMVELTIRSQRNVPKPPSHLLDI